MRIRLIEPEPPSVHLMSPWRYPRLGLPMIGAATAAVGHDVRIFCQQLAPIDWNDVLSADLVGLSTTTSTAPAAYAMADLLRVRGIPVVIGDRTSLSWPTRPCSTPASWRAAKAATSSCSS